MLAKYSKNDIKSIKIVGYTDPIGSESSNLKLSQNRANSVKNELVKQGVASSKILAYGAGESEQVKTCSESLSKKELIECLAPNRRVTIDIESY